LSDYRTGLGWDVHRLVHGRPLILGGIKIPSEVGSEGHSDADVLTHAMTDALLGAAAMGDIGQHFPDTDPRWKDAGSMQFLVLAMSMVRQQGYELVNIDSTVILERPKLKDFRYPIRENVSGVLGIDVEWVSVKFKTAERLGPVGEGRSIEAHAIVTIRKMTTSTGTHTYHV
jgi:2-C-methyl-D-erythritol 2,4-cyclodiphosphate synthase